MPSSYVALSRIVSRLLICLLPLLLFSPSLPAQQDCSKCDCNHFPIARDCYKCCDFATGTIASISNSALQLSVRDAEGQTAIKTFSTAALPPSNRALKKGTQATVYYEKNGNLAKRVDLTDRLQGLLKPGTEPNPSLPGVCSTISLPQDALKVYLGSSVVITTSKETAVFRAGGLDLLSIRRAPDGLAANATIFEKGGQVAASIVDNHFFINPSEHFRVLEPDPHTLLIASSVGEQVISLRYLNPTALRVMGTFYTREGTPIEVGQDQIKAGNLIFEGDCMVNAAVVVGLR